MGEENGEIARAEAIEPRAVRYRRRGVEMKAYLS